MNEGALANLDHDAALKEIANGVIAREIAERHGVTAEAVRQALKKANPEGYKEAVSKQVEHWVFDSADEMNNLAADALCIARARARGEFRLKLASKLNPAFADKQQVELTAPAGPLLNIVLSTNSNAVPQQVIDVSPSVKSIES
jgi:hypothetical protein